MYGIEDVRCETRSYVAGEQIRGSNCWLIDSRRLKGRAVKDGNCGSIGNIAPREAPRSQFADLADRLAMLRLPGQRWRQPRGEPSACREPARIKTQPDGVQNSPASSQPSLENSPASSQPHPEPQPQQETLAFGSHTGGTTE
jgi:hypothetical protein